MSRVASICYCTVKGKSRYFFHREGRHELRKRSLVLSVGSYGQISLEFNFYRLKLPKIYTRKGTGLLTKAYDSSPLFIVVFK